MTNGGINNVGALRLIVDESKGIAGMKLTDTQADAIMRCSSLEIAMQSNGPISSVILMYPTTGYAPGFVERAFINIQVAGESDGVAVTIYQLSYNKEQNIFTEKGATLTPPQQA